MDGSLNLSEKYNKNPTNMRMQNLPNDWRKEEIEQMIKNKVSFIDILFNFL